MDDDELQKLHVVFFPFMAYGHMIPTLDIARLFAARGVKTTIITTPVSLPIVTQAIEKAIKHGSPEIYTEIFSFPSAENGLPDGCETVNQAIKYYMIPKFMQAVEMLNTPLEQYLEKTRPHCLVSDMFLPWTTDCAAKFNVPRLVFHGTSYFALCAEEIVRVYKPYKNVSNDEETFILPSLPHEVKMTKSQFSEDFMKEELNESKKEFELIKESEIKSYGVIVNSFYELERDYADFFSKELGRRAWHIGPVSLCNRSIEDKAKRGILEASKDEHECLKWLNSKKTNSVIYICFGSMAQINASQMLEIAMGLEASQHDFIWVVKNDRQSEEELLPQGFEQRMEGKGLIIRGWVPQLLLLEHEAIGALLTHCGWNSILEGISTGLPMVTWPACTEQFYNEKLVTEILKIGVPVGAKKWNVVPYNVDYLVRRNAIEKAIREVMEGDEAQERRNRAMKLKEMALKAVEVDGSSYNDLGVLINELRHNKLKVV
ncbi:unnamed protein product [Amaranthus hypochondriacus]